MTGRGEGFCALKPPKPGQPACATPVYRAYLCALMHRLPGPSSGWPWYCGEALPSGGVTSGLHTKGETAGCADGSVTAGRLRLVAGMLFDRNAMERR
jgi:hypothetical protein